MHRSLILNLDRIGRIERGPRRACIVHAIDPGAAPVIVKRRHWPQLHARIESWRASRNTIGRSETRKSIAVLPFANLSEMGRDEVFCDGISEELLNVLAKVPGLRVAARTSSFYFKNRNLPVTEIGRRLGVEYVVEGSVRRFRNQVRITAQLIDAAAGFHLWSDNFEHDRTNALRAHDEIAAIIARNLRLNLGPTLRSPPSLSPDACRLALEGRHFWNLRTGDGFARAEAAFTGALVLEPDFAAAHAALADLAVVRAMYRLADGVADVSDDLHRTRRHAERALQLDPTLAEPHAAIGFACFHEGRLEDANPHFLRALEANPNYATGLQFYAWTLAGQGRLERALQEYENAITLDPLSFINLDRHAAMLALAGRHADALAANERASALRPDLFVGNVSQRAPILLALGRTSEAVAAAREVRHTAAVQPFRRNADADAIYTLHAAGQIVEAAMYAGEILTRYAPGNYLRGFVLSAIRRYDDAWPSLLHTPPIMLPQLYWSPVWDPVRRTSAFRQLIRDLGRTEEYRRARFPVKRAAGRN